MLRAMSDINDPRPLLGDAQRSSHVRAQVGAFHREIVDEVQRAVERDDIVVVGMAQNPFVKRARAALDAASIPFTYLEYGSYFSSWKQRLAIKLWSGWPTYPQVYVKGVLIGGNEELQGQLADGSLKQALAT